ncbi:hypothetical protein D3C77_448340 [compost metagenome]
MSRSCDRHDTLDLAVFLDPFQFKRIRTVHDDDDFVKMLRYRIDHAKLPIGQLQVMFIRIQIVRITEAFSAWAHRASIRIIGIRTVQHRRKVCPFSARTGKEDNRCVRKLGCLLHSFLGVELGSHGFWNRPIISLNPRYWSFKASCHVIVV